MRRHIEKLVIRTGQLVRVLRVVKSRILTIVNVWVVVSVPCSTVTETKSMSGTVVVALYCPLQFGPYNLLVHIYIVPDHSTIRYLDSNYETEPARKKRWRLPRKVHSAVIPSSGHNTMVHDLFDFCDIVLVGFLCNILLSGTVRHYRTAWFINVVHVL